MGDETSGEPLRIVKDDVSGKLCRPIGRAPSLMRVSDPANFPSETVAYASIDCTPDEADAACAVMREAEHVLPVVLRALHDAVGEVDEELGYCNMFDIIAAMKADNGEPSLSPTQIDGLRTILRLHLEVR